MDMTEEEYAQYVQQAQASQQQSYSQQEADAAGLFTRTQARHESDDFSKWQLETKQMIRTTGLILQGYNLEFDEDSNTERWVKGEDSEVVLTKQGANDVMGQMWPAVDKNVALSVMKEADVYRFVKNIIGNIIIRLGANADTYGLKDGENNYDETKIYKVKDVVEVALFAALMRANPTAKGGFTFSGVNTAHSVSEHKLDSGRRGWQMPWGRR
jgi:hypothetical protein